MQLNNNEKRLLRDYHASKKKFMITLGLIPSIVLFSMFFSILAFESAYVLLLSPILFIPLIFNFKSKALYIEFIRSVSKSNDFKEKDGKFYDKENYSYFFYINDNNQIVKKIEKIEIIE